MGNSESINKKNPLIPSGVIKKKPIINVDNLHNYQQQCKVWFQERKWLSLPIKQLLISTSKSQYRQSIPYIDEYFLNVDYVMQNGHKVFFGVLKSGDKISDKWYRPTDEYFKYLCDLSSNSCNIDTSIKEAVIYTNDTFRILDDSDYNKQCEWWKENVLNSDKNIQIMIQNIKMNSINDKHYIDNIRKIIIDIVGEDIEIEYYKKNISNTICDYLKNVLTYIASTSSDLKFNQHTKQFRKRVYSNDKLPYLSIEDVIDNYSLLPNETKEEVRHVFNDFIEDKMNDILARASVLYKQKQYTHHVKEVCDKNIPKIDIVMYKEDDVIYCLSIQQLLNRISNVNPYTGKEISSTFLENFDKEFKTQKDEYICENCESVITDNKITLGKLVNDIPYTQHFCSSECVEEKEKEIKLLNEQLKKSKYIQNKLFKLYDETTEIKLQDALLNEKLKLKENDIKSLQDYINKLQNEKQSFESNLESCSVDNITHQNKYKNKINELQNKIKEDESRLNNLIQSKTKLENELSQYSSSYIQERDKLNDKIQKMEQMLIEQQDKIKIEFINHISKIKSKDNEIEKLKTMLSSTTIHDKDKIQGVELHLKQLENENKELKKYLEKFFENLKQQDNDLKSRQKYIEQLQKEKSDTIKNMQMKDLEQINKLTQLLQNESTNKSQIQRLEQEKKECQLRVSDTDQVNNLKRDISSLKFKMASMVDKDERDKLLYQINSLKSQLLTCSPQSSSDILKLKLEIESEKAKTKLAENNVRNIRGELNVIQELNKSLTNQLTELNNIIKQNQMQINAVREEADRETKELTHKLSTTIDIAEKSRLEQEILEIKRKNELFANKKQDEINESMKTNIELNQKLKDVQTDIEKQILELKTEEVDKMNALEQIKNELNQTREENKKLLESCKTSEQYGLDKKEDEIKTKLLSTENDKLKEELNNLKTKIEELNKTLQDKDGEEGEINRLREEIKMMEQKCESSTCNVELEKLKIELSNQQSLVNEFEIKNNKLSEELDELNTQLLESKHDTSSLKNLEHQVTEKEKDKNELKQELDNAKVIENELADKIRELSDSKNKCDDKLEQIGEQYEKKLEALQLENDKLLLKEQRLEKEMKESEERYKQIHLQGKLDLIETQKEEIQKLKAKAELLNTLNKRLLLNEESSVIKKQKDDLLQEEMKRKEEQLKEDEMKRKEEQLKEDELQLEDIQIEEKKDDIDSMVKKLTEQMNKLPTQ